MKNKDISIAVIGLGYVGLPLANGLSKNFKTIGYDINSNKITELKVGHDQTNELKKINKSLKLTSKLKDLEDCNFYIFCLPTPVDNNKKPDLKILNKSLKLVSNIYNPDDTIILESTFYPGATEELVNKYFKKDQKKINIGYSPERINPGDKKNIISKITKVVSANNTSTLNIMKKIYGSLNNNNIYAATNIKVAEAAKLIENVQRDLNIGLINELSQIFDKIDISVHDVLSAAKTKWNFLNFKPGLVGGHCIGVDPYYLKYLCDKVKFKPKVFMSARNTNEDMISFYKKKIIKNFDSKSKILYLGVTFKENTNDLRNSKYLDLLKIISKNHKVHYYDPLAKNLGKLDNNLIKYKKQLYDVIIFAVPHNKLFYFLKKNLKSLIKTNGTFIDLNNNYKFPLNKSAKYICL
jgi:UDP-N-acetyl-D-glucosamine/UDP-N-acetyl-D-galactosamine dehydrogenase